MDPSAKPVRDRIFHGLQNPYLHLEILDLTLQLLNRLLQLGDLDFGLLHAVPMKSGRRLELLVLRDRGDLMSAADFTMSLPNGLLMSFAT